MKGLSYMMRIPLSTMRSIMESHNVFDIESIMYRSVVAEMEQMYRDAGVEVKFIARYYDVQTPSQFDVIMLEDLGNRNFKNVNRLEGLDMEHTKSVLRKLAQRHAASATRVQIKGSYIEDLMVGFFSKQHFGRMNQIYENINNIFLECAKSFKDNEEYIENLVRNDHEIFLNIFTER